MVYSPAPIPFSRGSAKPKPFFNNNLAIDAEPFGDDPPSATLDSLRQQIEAGASIDVILAAIAAAAQNLSRASGAAIAMGHDGVVLCVGRSGDTAPELGAQLSVDSGISGECIRSGKSLLCDDTQLDSRVDPDVCLRLGLRSIIAVPLYSADGMVGILEVFSSYPSNFSSGHVETMQNLAALVALAHNRISGTDRIAEEIRESMVLPVASSPTEVALAAVATAEPRTIEWLRDSEPPTEARKIPYWLAAPILVLIMLSFRVWMAWHEPVVTPTHSPVAAQPANDSADSIELSFTPPRSGKHHAGRDAAKVREKSSDGADTPEIVVHKFEGQSEPDSKETKTQAAAAETDNDAPQLPLLNTNNAALGTILQKSSVIPTKALPISQGVVRGSLEYRVQPKYPEQALSMRLSGPVVLLASINETGNVHHLKVVSGPPVLAEAAIDAVRQWRYQPSRLNGVPIGIETQITVNFKAP